MGFCIAAKADTSIFLVSAFVPFVGDSSGGLEQLISFLFVLQRQEGDPRRVFRLVRAVSRSAGQPVHYGDAADDGLTFSKNILCGSYLKPLNR